MVSSTPTCARLRAKTPTATVPAAATPTAASTPAPPALEHAQYVYDGDNNLVKSVINGVETYYIGQYYEKVVDGESTIVRFSPPTLHQLTSSFSPSFLLH